MELKEIPIKRITPNPRQPREGFPREELGELASSIVEFGVLQPIIVRSTKEETYQIVAGERRWRAASLTDLEKIPAFVKDVDSRQQMVESLIENVHRKDLSSIEKGKAAYQLFLLNEIDLRPKEIADSLHAMRVRESRGSPVVTGTTDEGIFDVCKNQIHKPFGTVRDWLGSISVPEKIQRAEVKKPKEERVSGKLLRRISTLPAEEQEPAHAKIEKEGMDQEKGSRFVTVIKKLALGAREYALKSESRVPIGAMEKVLELPKEEQEKALEQMNSLRLTEEEAIEHIEAMKVEITPPSKAEWDELRQRYQKIQEETKERLSRPEAQKRGKLFQNWLAHSTAMGTLDTIRCPICNAPPNKLGWSCDEHDFIDIKEAMERAEEKYQDSIGE